MNIPFEIHITGDSTINEALDKLGIKNIIIELLKPNGCLLRTEYMSSFVVSLQYSEIHEYVLDIVSKLTECNIVRVKIESPPITHLFPMSLYVESHFIPKGNNYPLSRNTRSGKILGTDREYSKSKYLEFLDKWKDEDCELCIFDTFKEEDYDWFNLYNFPIRKSVHNTKHHHAHVIIVGIGSIGHIDHGISTIIDRNNLEEVFEPPTIKMQPLPPMIPMIEPIYYEEPHKQRKSRTNKRKFNGF